MSPEELDEAAGTGRFAGANRWLKLADYLGTFVRDNAAESVLPVPAGAQPEQVHATTHNCSSRRTLCTPSS